MLSAFVRPPRPVSSRTARALAGAALSAACVLGATSSAHADVSSWAYVGAGLTSLEQRGLELHLDPSLAIEVGMGTPPTHAIVVGGMFRTLTLFGDGTDLGLSARVATRGFVNGDFGLALDAGPYQRFWGEGSTGGHAALVLGAPWGITLSVSGGMGSHDAKYYGATLGLDFARLTVHRTTGQNWFPNPQPGSAPRAHAPE